MNSKDFTTPLPLTRVRITDPFWHNQTELVRTEVLPYQWAALNDAVPGATPSYCMHNFEAAVRQNSAKCSDPTYTEPSYTFRGFEALPDDPAHPDPDKFYGFVFQDSDLYKWLEAVAYSLAQHPDAALEALADGAIEKICAAQQEDGYLDTYYILNGKDKIFSNLRDHHELYCFGHLAEAAVAYKQATGKDALLHAACRYADYIAARFGPEPGRCHGYPGHEIAEMALLRLYEETGEPRYFALSRYFIDERGKRPYYFDTELHPETTSNPPALNYRYNQAHLPVRAQDEAVGHAVRAVYLYSGMADMARLSGDESLLAACERLWRSVTRQKLYITGGIGATHIGEAFSYPFDLPNDAAYTETCAAIGLVFWAARMLQISPKAEYADVLERALYNNVLSGMALDGKSFFYVNPLEVNPTACHADERLAHVKPVRQKWLGCACCPPNLARLLSSVSRYGFTQNEDTLFVHLHLGSELETSFAGKPVQLRIESRLPWQGRVQMTVVAPEAPFTLAVCIPAWGRAYRLTTSIPCESLERDGYLYLQAAWGDGAVLTFDFPLEVCYWRATPRVRADNGKLAVTRGPLVYCLEQADNGPDLNLISIEPGTAVTVEPAVIAGETVQTLRMRGWRTPAPTAEAPLYAPAEPTPPLQETSLRWVPYYTWANRGENEMTVWVHRKYK